MQRNRRDFLKLCGLAGLGLAVPLRYPVVAAPARNEPYEGPYYIVFNASGGWDTTYLMDPKGVNGINRLYKEGDIQTQGNHKFAPTAGHAQGGMTNEDFYKEFGSELLVVNGIDYSVNNHSPGARYMAMRPTLADFVLKMPRGAQVIYPKDLGPLLMLADIHDGVRVLEAGVGSGALSMTMLRTGASVVGYELRPDFAARATANVKSFLGDGVDFRVEDRDVYEGIDETDLDRVVLDLPEPWRVVKHAEAALHRERLGPSRHGGDQQVVAVQDVVHHGHGGAVVLAVVPEDARPVLPHELPALGGLEGEVSGMGGH